MVKIHFITIWNANISTIYETLFQNVTKMLPTIHQNKTKIPGKTGNVRVESWINYIEVIWE